MGFWLGDVWGLGRDRRFPSLARLTDEDLSMVSRWSPDRSTPVTVHYYGFHSEDGIVC